MSIYGNGLSGSHVQMWELNHKGGWTPKKWCFWTVVLEKTLESPLDCKEIKLVNPKGNQFWIFIGRIDAEAETPILWPPDAKNWFTGKDPDAGKDWRQEKGTTEEWDGWMASLTRWTWIWVNSGRWWRTGKPRVLQPIGLQRVGHNWVTINNNKPLALEFLRWRCSCALFYPMKSCLNINMTHTDIKKKRKSLCLYWKAFCPTYIQEEPNWHYSDGLTVHVHFSILRKNRHPWETPFS